MCSNIFEICLKHLLKIIENTFEHPEHVRVFEHTEHVRVFEHLRVLEHPERATFTVYSRLRPHRGLAL